MCHKQLCLGIAPSRAKAMARCRAMAHGRVILSMQSSELSVGLDAARANVCAGSGEGLPGPHRERLFLTWANVGYRSGLKLLQPLSHFCSDTGPWGRGVLLNGSSSGTVVCCYSCWLWPSDGEERLGRLYGRDPPEPAATSAACLCN